MTDPAVPRPQSQSAGDRAARPDTRLVVSRIADRTTVLGPGCRAAVWVRGCPLRCAGCVSPEDLPFTGGIAMTVTSLAGRLNALPPDVAGVTFSGGEPMAQAGALAMLVDLLRAERDWSVMSYTGFTIERLHHHGDAAQHALLDRLDILVDGPYLRRQHASLAWRGSANQRLHFLTGRHQPPVPDTSSGLEFELSGDTLTWTGVPPVAGFRQTFETVMAAEGVSLRAEGDS